MKSPYTVILFTGSYPYEYDVEHTFLAHEVEYLSSCFERVIIVPQRLEGKKFNLPDKVEVDESYGLRFKELTGKRIRNHLHKWFFSLLIKDLLRRPLTLLQYNALCRSVYFVIKTQIARGWFIDFIIKNNLDVERSVFYTYWLNHITLGIGLAKDRYPQIKLVSRAHGRDLYKHRWNPPYFPCRYETLKCLDRLFLVSEHGREHITDLYPWLGSFCEVSRLGVRNPGFITPSSKDGIFRIVSCSFMIDVKRLHLLLKGINCVAELRKYQIFEWHHIGDGPLFDQIQNMVQGEEKHNVRYNFYGYLSHEDVMLFYKENPLDVFMNVSESEGLSVSIMEAQSCSLPVIATAVGGNSEIVSNENGKLLNPNPPPAEIAQAICDMLDNPNLLQEKKSASQRMWQDKLDADQNFKGFVQRLISMVNHN
ncbi:MAG: glycosyltransferase [Candidatus Scalindua sp.]